MPARSRTSRRYHTALGAGIALAALSLSTAARAFDPFEIQVYDGTLNAVGEGGLELHTNYVAKGQSTAEAPELPSNHTLHTTLEPSIGVTPWLELGAYLQGAHPDGGPYRYAGTKLRAKLVLPHDEKAKFRFGLNFEVSALPEAFERDVYGGEMRPIAAFEDEGWIVAFNPIVSFGFQGRGWHEGPALEPALAVYRKVFELYSFGVEYYSSLGPIKSPDKPRDQLHYLFMAWNVYVWQKWELNVGVGGGLTAASDGMVMKSILGRSF